VTHYPTISFPRVIQLQIVNHITCMEMKKVMVTLNIFTRARKKAASFTSLFRKVPALRVSRSSAVNKIGWKCEIVIKSAKSK
jgi:hypothetical protein